MNYNLMKVEDGSKCPKCLFIGRTFLIINDVLSACMDCGCVFVLKGKRLEIRQEIQERMNRVVETKTNCIADSLNCDVCDFVGKSVWGLTVHKAKKHARDKVKS